MTITYIYHTYTRLPIFSTMALLFVNYNLYRVIHGTHPYMSPRLEQAGIHFRPPPKSSRHSDHSLQAQREGDEAIKRLEALAAEAERRKYAREEKEFGKEEADLRSKMRKERKEKVLREMERERQRVGKRGGGLSLSDIEELGRKKGANDGDEKRQERKKGNRIEWPKSEGPDWTFINGVPVPSFDLLTRPFRRE